MAWSTATVYFGKAIRSRWPWNRWKGSYQVFLTTDTAVKLEGVEPWLHLSQMKRDSPDTWSSSCTGDLESKLTRKLVTSCGRQPLPQMLDWGFTLKLTSHVKLFLFLFLSHWHWPGKIMPSSVSPRPLLSGIIFQTMSGLDICAGLWVIRPCPGSEHLQSQQIQGNPKKRVRYWLTWRPPRGFLNIEYLGR